MQVLGRDFKLLVVGSFTVAGGRGQIRDIFVVLYILTLSVNGCIFYGCQIFAV